VSKKAGKVNVAAKIRSSSQKNWGFRNAATPINSQPKMNSSSKSHHVHD
jgi:hypothetical protein